MNATFTLPEQSAGLVRLFGMEPAGYEPDIPAVVFLKSFTLREIQYGSRPAKSADGFRQVSDWANGFRAVWVNEPEMAIFTYCEGDLDLTVDADQATFAARLAAAAAFYKQY